MNEVTKKMISALNADMAMDHIKWLTENTPDRMSGKGQDRKAADYIMKKLGEYGCETKLLEFHTYNSWPEYSDLKVLSPETITIKSIPCCHIASTLPEGIKAELVYVGPGGYEEYKDKDVRGKVVLVEVSYAPATPEKARIAAEKGAVGIICMNWGGDEDVICRRALKAVWGNPTPETFKNIPQLAGVSITRKAGEYLTELCKNNEKVEILLNVKSTRQWMNLAQPIGILKGSEKPEQFLLVSAHLDAWKPGVTCNATGDGVTLELARVFGKYKNDLKRSILFTFWNGHEIAEACGSTWFADNYWDKLRDNCVGYINIDSPGMKDAKEFAADASRELSDYAEGIIKNTVHGEGKVNYLTKTGDQSFFGLGIPSIAGRVSFDEEYVKKTHGATLGWWNHTIEDTLDKVDINNLKEDLIANCAIIADLVINSIIPYDFSKTCEDVRTKLNIVNKKAGDLVELNSILEKVDMLDKSVKKLNNIKKLYANEEISNEKVEMINKVLLMLSRTLTNALYTYADKYNQDSYGHSVLSKPIPLLYPAIELKDMDKDSLEYKLKYTLMVKNRNRVSDAINSALETVNLHLKLLEK